jgi:hypothetical protein
MPANIRTGTSGLIRFIALLEICARIVALSMVVNIGFHRGLIVFMASLKSRRTCSSLFRAWLSS